MLSISLLLLLLLLLLLGRVSYRARIGGVHRQLTDEEFFVQLNFCSEKLIQLIDIDLVARVAQNKKAIR